MKLGLLLHSPEEELDCFSDNTHMSHFYDAKGIRNVYLGRYNRIDGRVVSGPSLADLVRENAPALDQEMQVRLNVTMAAMHQMANAAEDGESYDQMIRENNPVGNARVQAAIDGLVAQTRTLEKIIGTLGIQPISFEGSDSLDAPKAVFK